MTAGRGDHGGLWNYIEGLREDLGRAEDRIHALEQTVSVYGETLDDVRNKIYNLEHDIRHPRQFRYEADFGGDEVQQ